MWGPKQQESFRQLKDAISKGPVLILPDPELPFVVHTDASGFAVGAVLQQDQGKGLQPIAFLSKKMLDAETRYPVHEQELLAIITALGAWRHYLHGRKFTRDDRPQVAGVLQDAAAAVRPPVEVEGRHRQLRLRHRVRRRQEQRRRRRALTQARPPAGAQLAAAAGGERAQLEFDDLESALVPRARRAQLPLWSQSPLVVEPVHR